MAKGLGLEELKNIFRDDKTHIAVARIEQLSIVSDLSCLKCKVSIFPEQREVIAKMSWDAVGPGSGIFQFPEKNDLVLVAFADADDDSCFVINRLTNKEDKIPLNAVDGHLVMKSKTGKKAWVTSDTRVNLSNGDGEPTENLVLGQQLKTLLTTVLADLNDLSTKLSTHTHTCSAPASPGSPPIQATDFVTLATAFDNLKTSPVSDSAILSDFAFTEKGA